MPTKVPLMIKRKTPPIVKVSIDGRCAKLNKTDGTSTAIYLFHLLSSSLIMKPRNSISSNIPAFKAIRIDEMIIKKISPVEKTFTCARPMIRNTAFTTESRCAIFKISESVSLISRHGVCQARPGKVFTALGFGYCNSVGVVKQVLSVRRAYQFFTRLYKE